MAFRNSLRIVVLTGYGSGLAIPILGAGYRVVGLMEPENTNAQLGGPIRIAKKLLSLLQGAKTLPMLEAVARRHGIDYLDLSGIALTEVKRWLRAREPDLLVVYKGPILDAELLQIPVLGAINLHPSLLPRYRGGHPLLWMSANMDLDGGVTVHFLDEQVDTGDILAQASFPIALGMNEDEIERIAIEKFGIPLMIRVIDAVSQGRVKRIPQSAVSPTPIAKRVSNENYWKMIDWENWPIEHVWHFLRCTKKWQSRLPRDTIRSYRNYEIGDIEVGVQKRGFSEIRKDDRGLHFVHPQGKIRIRSLFSPLKLIKMTTNHLSELPKRIRIFRR